MTDDDSTHPGAFAMRATRKAKFAGGAKKERGFRRTLLDRDIADKGAKIRSEKSRSAWRNDPKRDEEIYRYINEKLRSKQPVRLSTKSSYLVSESRKKLADATRTGTRIIPELFVPHWDHSSRILKMIGWGMASQHLGAVPFTLRISPDVVETAKGDKVGFARHVQDRLARHLRYRCPGATPTFWFVIEQGTWDEPHLHGAVVIPEGERDAVRDALSATGGTWTSSARQVQFGRSGNLIKWVGYSTKWLYGSMVKMGDDNLIGASQGMRREAKRLYQETRQRNLVLYP